jgi:FMN-dependent NADH-azoreductase
MPELLLIASSAFGGDSKTTQIANEFISAWRKRNPHAHVVMRDLGAQPVPHLTGEYFGALAAPVAERSQHQRKMVQASDALIEEVEAADIIVIAAPMYNFTIASTLKAWLDHVTRAGRTFRYSSEGPEGLLRNKKVVVVTARGGIYSGNSPTKGMDFQEPYLRAMLSFIGLEDISFIHVEGLRISPEAAAEGIARARKAINEIVPAAHAA